MKKKKSILATKLKVTLSFIQTSYISAAFMDKTMTITLSTFPEPNYDFSLFWIYYLKALVLIFKNIITNVLYQRVI